MEGKNWDVLDHLGQDGESSETPENAEAGPGEAAPTEKVAKKRVGRKPSPAKRKAAEESPNTAAGEASSPNERTPQERRRGQANWKLRQAAVGEPTRGNERRVDEDLNAFRKEPMRFETKKEGTVHISNEALQKAGWSSERFAAREASIEDSIHEQARVASEIENNVTARAKARIEAELEAIAADAKAENADLDRHTPPARMAKDFKATVERRARSVSGTPQADFTAEELATVRSALRAESYGDLIAAYAEMASLAGEDRNSAERTLRAEFSEKDLPRLKERLRRAASDLGLEADSLGDVATPADKTHARASLPWQGIGRPEDVASAWDERGPIEVEVSSAPKKRVNFAERRKNFIDAEPASDDGEEGAVDEQTPAPRATRRRAILGDTPDRPPAPVAAVPLPQDTEEEILARGEESVRRARNRIAGEIRADRKTDGYLGNRRAANQRAAAEAPTDAADTALAIESASDFEDLYEVLRAKAPDIIGGTGVYRADDVIEIIEAIRREEPGFSLENVTKTFGIRDAAARMLDWSHPSNEEGAERDAALEKTLAKLPRAEDGEEAREETEPAHQETGSTRAPEPGQSWLRRVGEGLAGSGRNFGAGVLFATKKMKDLLGAGLDRAFYESPNGGKDNPFKKERGPFYPFFWSFSSFWKAIGKLLGAKPDKPKEEKKK